MKPASILLLTAVFLISAPLGLSPHKATLSSGALSSQSLQPECLGPSGTQGTARPTIAQVTTRLGSLPLSFVENKGQVDDQVGYYTKTKSGTVYFTNGGIVYQFLVGNDAKNRSHGSPVVREEAIRVSFVGANKKTLLEARGEQEALFSYFRGSDPQKWVSGARSYQKVAYRELYPGIDLVVSGTQGRMKNEYVIRAGADPAAIRLHYQGARSLRVNKKGQLEIQASEGMLVEDVPLSYQLIDGTKREVKTKYRVGADETVRFEVGAYRKDTELTIDPLIYATFLGGGTTENGRKIAVDGSGNVYVTGNTTSSNFPTTAGAYDTSQNGASYPDVFVTKLNSTGSSLLFSTFIGGSLTDQPRGLAVDGTGNVFVVGSTQSTNYPTTSGVFDTSHNGGYDAFVTRLNSSGTTLLYSTYVGASANDQCYSIAIDGSGNAYISGDTWSNSFPTTAGAFDTTWNAGSNDSYVAKLNSSGTALSYSTYLGGSGNEYAYGITIDGTGNAFITGITTSTLFPTTSGAFDTTHNGANDGFITMLNSSGSALVYSTYLGGINADYSYGISVDGSGNACITGYTTSPGFPTTSGAYDTSHNGSNDVFVTRLDSTGAALLFSTFLGGTSAEYAYHIAADGSGNLYITGYTQSTNFPSTSGAYDTSHNGGDDAYIAKLNSSGTALLYSSFLGGTLNDSGYGLAVDGSGNAYVVGYTYSTDFPATTGAYDTSQNGEWDAFVAKFATTGGTPDIRQPIEAISYGNVAVGNYSELATSIYNDGTLSLTINSISRTSGSTEFSYISPSVPFSISAAGSQSVTVRFSPTSAGAKSAVFNVNSDDPDEPDVTFDVSGTGLVVAETVSTPSEPSGSGSGSIGTSYTYTTGGSTSNFGHDVQYLFDWGDGTDSGWLGVGTTSAEKSWSTANIYQVKAKARCATHTEVESSWSSSLSVYITLEGYDNSPSNYQVIPECIWAVASGGGTWVSDVQVTDITGGSVVSVYFNYGGGSRRGPFNLWTSPGANQNAKFSNILSSIDALDSEAFTYYGRVGAVEFSTQDDAHKIQVTARTLNGDYSKTFPGLNLTDSNTADTTRRMILQNFVNNATYRSSCGFFNPTADPVTVQVRLYDGDGNQVGFQFYRTLVGHDFQSFSPFNQAGIPYPQNSYDNIVMWITPDSDPGKVMVYGATANNTSNDPAAHIGVQYQGTYDNAPGNYKIIPECIWAVATGGGTWASEVQITDITGGSVVSVYFDYGAGNRRGPFTLWTSPGADRNVKYTNILSSIDALDSEAFTYYGRVGAVEFSTQDASHKIQVVARTLNGDYSKTFPGLSLTDSNTANTSRRMMIQNFVNNATYRSSCGFFNPTADSVTVEFRLLDGNGTTIGSTFSKTLVAYDFQSFSPFNQAGVPYPTYSYDNAVLWITPTSGSGKVMVYGATANNTSNDPAAHIGVQFQ